MHSRQDQFGPSLLIRLLHPILLATVFQINLLSPLPVFERVAIDNAPPRNPWIKKALSDRGSHNIIAADIDGNGRTDIVGANHGGAYQPVELWLNLPPKHSGTDELGN